MQNIPGLSFFDGLTRSRAANQGRTSSSTLPTETPLQDAASLRSGRGSDPLAHPLGTNTDDRDGGQGETTDTFEDQLSPSVSNTSFPSVLPVASFSRRPATVSAGSSPTPGQPGRRTTSSSTTGRSSILSKDGIFSSPVLSHRPSSIADGSTAQSGRERSGSSASSKESEEPTAKDVTLMAQGTQAYRMLKRIQEHPIELADIIRMLVTKKAILALPTCVASTEEPITTRATFENHVIIPEGNYGESLFVTLSGIRGVLKPVSSSIVILGLASGQDFSTIVSDASMPTKRSFFDNISKSEPGSEGPGGAGDLPSHELKLVNSSKRPVVIFVESVGSIHALLIDKIIPLPEGSNSAPTPIVPLAMGLSTVKDRSAARRTASSASSVRSMSISDDKDAMPLPKLPKIASDIPLEWDGTVRDLESFVVKLKRSPLSTTDKYANEFQKKYDDVRHRFEVYGSVSGLKHRWSDQDFDEMQQWVEAWLCREMYHIIFPHSAHGINKQDFLQDEQLQAKIAALNFLDLTLEHLGFALEHPEDVEHIERVVREGGVEMQKLATVKSPSDKMNVILSSHRVVVDALNREPAVQELLVEVEEANDASSSDRADEGSRDKADATLMTARRRSKRLSIPKIVMDGDFLGLNSSNSLSATQSPKIPMNEGYNRPSQVATEANKQIANAAEPETTEEKPNTESGEKETEGGYQEATDSKDGIEKNVTVKSEHSDNKESDTTHVNPADIELPKSPELESGTAPSLVIFDTAAPLPTAGTATVAAPTDFAANATASAASSTTSRRQYSADVLLPLLIFSVVKSNPPMLISNLRYIQRFKVQDQLKGELAYCLTNMMAVVSFLETLDPQALGLSSDIRVLSDVSDIQVSAGKFNHPQTPLINFQEGLDHTKALGHKVSQDIVGVAEEGIKVISDVVQDGYSKFFGRFLTTADGGLPFGSSQNKLNRGTRSMSAASSLAATAAADAAAEEERKNAVGKEEMSGGDKGLAGLVSPAGVTSDVTTLSVDGTAAVFTANTTEKSSSHDSDAAKNRALEYVKGSEGPQFQFMACTDSGDLRLSDVKSLLEDYQRIGKILEEMKRLA